MISLWIVCGDIHFTNDKLKNSIITSLGDNVPVYDDNGKNTAHSWGALGKSQFQHGELK